MDYLTKNPIVKYKEFRLYATKLYTRLNCNFKIYDYTFSNIYYNWRKNSNVFNKNSIFDNKFTNSNDILLTPSIYTHKCFYIYIKRQTDNFF